MHKLVRAKMQQFVIDACVVLGQALRENIGSTRQWNSMITANAHLYRQDTGYENAIMKS
jgi:hypothetical protein